MAKHVEQLPDYNCDEIKSFNFNIISKLRSNFNLVCHGASSDNSFDYNFDLKWSDNDDEKRKLIDGVRGFKFFSEWIKLPEYEEINNHYNLLEEMFSHSYFCEVQGAIGYISAHMGVLKDALESYPPESDLPPYFLQKIDDVLLETCTLRQSMNFEPYPDAENAYNKLWDCKAKNFAEVENIESSCEKVSNLVVEFLNRRQNLSADKNKSIKASTQVCVDINKQISAMKMLRKNAEIKYDYIHDAIMGSLISAILKGYSDACQENFFPEIKFDAKKDSKKKPDIKQKIPKTKNKNKIKTPSPIKKGPSDLMNLENAVSGVLKIIDDLEAQSDINPWVNKAHFDAIKKFSVHRFSASHIVPPGKDSLINALESADNPLLSNVKIFPSREIGSGESIDQHVRKRHPNFFSDVCKNEADQFDNIRRLSEVAISVLNDIESIRESDEFNIPYENIMIKVPTLLVEGRFKGEKVRVVLSKPYNKLLGFEVFDRVACLVVRSIYPVEDILQSPQRLFA